MSDLEGILHSSSFVRRLERICDEFEAAWKGWRGGDRPAIEGFIHDSLSAPQRVELLRELLCVEFVYRRVFGEAPTPQEYLARFPGDSTIVQAAFSEAAAVNAYSRVLKIGEAHEVNPGPTSESALPSREQKFLMNPAGAFGRFGRYLIRGKLGKGGMGTVYLAEDTALGRRVALKVPSFGPGDKLELLVRFSREAQAVARIRHPNICPVFDVGEFNGLPYFTMAYIEGRPLSDVIQALFGGNVEDTVNLVRTLALALNEAHRIGVIHRDLKPSNVIIDRIGQPVLVDFGLAKRLYVTDAKITAPEVILGTPAYMAPEQVAGSTDLGPACDIYSLGVILYELLTGQRPFGGPLASLLAKITTTEPNSPGRLRSDLDPRLVACCLTAMAKDPSARFESMADFAQALGEMVLVPGASLGWTESATSKSLGAPIAAESTEGEFRSGSGSHNPSAEALKAALRVVKSKRGQQPLLVRNVRTIAELHALWLIDKTAYGDVSLSFESFRGWWMGYPKGLWALFSGADVLGALGMWPLSRDWAKSFKGGLVRESAMPASMLRSLRGRRAKCWYVSGIVLHSDLKRTKAIKLLLSDAFRLWLEEGEMGMPMEILALAYSLEGKALLERFGCTRVQNGDAMPDGFPLYLSSINSRDQLIELFKLRGSIFFTTKRKELERTMQNEVVLLETTDISDFLPLMRELDFGDQFLLSMLHWCGIGKRKKPLAFWQVYNLKRGEESVGVAGLYQEHDAAPGQFWVGWFGILPPFRRQGFANQVLQNLKHVARDLGCTELWVYTDKENTPALRLYLGSGFVLLGKGGDVCPSRTPDPLDAVLRCHLCSSAP